MDLIQNSGRLKGACDQVIADTVGVGLTLTPDPDLTGLGYDEKEKAELIRLLKRRWKAFWSDKKECDMRGKLSGPQMIDIGLRWDIAFGEVTGVFDFFDDADRSHYGISTGTKLCLVPPSKLVQDTNALEGMFQGVRHDGKGRPVSYRFDGSQSGMKVKQDYAAYDADGRPMVMHIFDPMDATDACCSPSHIRCRQLFPNKSFNTTLSNIVSARRRFSLAFSSSRVLRRWVSEMFMPPYLALNL